MDSQLYSIYGVSYTWYWCYFYFKKVLFWKGVCPNPSNPSPYSSVSNSYTCMYQHFEFLFVAFAILVWPNHYHRFTEISQSCAKQVFYIHFVGYAECFCNLCIMLIIMCIIGSSKTVGYCTCVGGIKWQLRWQHCKCIDTNELLIWTNIVPRVKRTAIICNCIVLVNKINFNSLPVLSLLQHLFWTHMHKIL